MPRIGRSMADLITHSMLYMFIPSELPTAKDCLNILNTNFVVVKLRVLHLIRHHHIHIRLGCCPCHSQWGWQHPGYTEHWLSKCPCLTGQDQPVNIQSVYTFRPCLLKHFLAFWVVRLRVFHFDIWCHRSNGLWCSHCNRAVLGQRCSVPMFHYRGA